MRRPACHGRGSGAGRLLPVLLPRRPLLARQQPAGPAGLVELVGPGQVPGQRAGIVARGAGAGPALVSTGLPGPGRAVPAMEPRASVPAGQPGVPAAVHGRVPGVCAPDRRGAWLGGGAVPAGHRRQPDAVRGVAGALEHHPRGGLPLAAAGRHCRTYGGRAPASADRDAGGGDPAAPPDRGAAGRTLRARGRGGEPVAVPGATRA